jgi:hypothetical protein
LNVNQYGIDGSFGFGIPLCPSESEWVVFRGGLDHVIFPEELRKITKVYQRGINVGTRGASGGVYSDPFDESRTRWVFNEIKVQCEISGEGLQTVKVEKVFLEDIRVWP